MWEWDRVGLRGWTRAGKRVRLVRRSGVDPQRRQGRVVASKLICRHRVSCAEPWTTRLLGRAVPRIAGCVEMRVVCVGSALCVFRKDKIGYGDIVDGDGGGGRCGLCW